MRTPLMKRYWINTWHWSNSNTTTKQNKGLACSMSQKQTYDRSHIVSCVCWKDILGATWIPTYKTPETSWLCNQVLGIRGSIISHPKLTNPTSSCIHPSTHNQETFGNHLPQPSKSIRYTSYGNTPELPPRSTTLTCNALNAAISPTCRSMT